MYTSSTAFLSGAAEQVAEVYYKLGGNVLDIELSPSNVYAAYENAVLEYSYLMNIHQGKNVLGDIIGAATASFDHDGEQTTGPGHIELKYPKYKFSFSRRAMQGFGEY